SVVGTIGNASQSSYSAANAAMDALAARRRQLGLPAKSLAWGAWGEVGVAERLDDAILKRLRRNGLVPFGPEVGMRLLDEALTRPESVLVPAHLDVSALQSMANERPEALSSVLRGLVRVVRRAAQRTTSGTLLAQRLALLPEPERQVAMLQAV